VGVCEVGVGGVCFWGCVWWGGGGVGWVVGVVGVGGGGGGVGWGGGRATLAQLLQTVIYSCRLLAEPLWGRSTWPNASSASCSSHNLNLVIL